MRVKVESIPPLPHVKAWFSAHALPSILHLKTSLCTDLHPLSHAHVRPDHILLLLDDFELLDSSPIDVLRDGDLIVVKKRPQTTSAKRKASSQVPSPAHKRTKINDGRSLSRTSRPPAASARTTAKPHAHVAVESSSSSDSTSDSEDDSPSDTDSDSDSDSSDSESSSSSTSSTSGSTSSTSSTSSSDSASIPRTSKQTSNGAPPKPSKPAPPPVPPGLGKPATHSRNLRRRRKKMYERIAQTAEPASVNDIPLGTRAHPLTSSPAPSAEPEQHPSQALVNGATSSKGNDKAKGKEPDRQHPAAAPAFMMASLQNKNKRRGFKSAMSLGVPPKIYFPDASAAGTSSQAHPHSADLDPDAQLVEAALQVHPSPPAPASASASRPASRAQPRLVPPSEKQERGQIPANMFVTSVDVEEGLWPARRTKSSKKKKKKHAPAEEDAQWAHEDEDTFAAGLPYDDPPEAPAAAAPMSQSDGGAAQSTEHAVVAATWDTLRKIAEKSQVRPGATVGWKALGINFATLTPEMLLHVGRVIRSDDDQLVVEPFAEPSVEEVSFGGAVVAEDGAAVEETFEWPDVLSGDWRLVSAA